MGAGIYYEISIIVVLEDNAFMTDSLKRKLQVQLVGDADKLMHYLEWENCLCVIAVLFAWGVKMNIFTGQLMF